MTATRTLAAATRTLAAEVLLIVVMTGGCGGGSDSTPDAGKSDVQTGGDRGPDQIGSDVAVDVPTADQSGDTPPSDGGTDSSADTGTETPADAADAPGPDGSADTAADLSTPDLPTPDAPEPEAPTPDAPEPDAPTPDAPAPDAPAPDLASDLAPDLAPDVAPSCAPASNEAGPIVMTEIYFGGAAAGADYVVIKNVSGATVSLATWNICGQFTYNAIGGALGAGATRKIVPTWDMDGTASVAIYDSGTFSSATSMVDFAQWGLGDQARATVALMAGLWPSTGDFVDVAGIDFGESLHYDGACNGPASYSIGPKSF